jgi:hypothetical protein
MMPVKKQKRCISCEETRQVKEAAKEAARMAKVMPSKGGKRCKNGKVMPSQGSKSCK